MKTEKYSVNHIIDDFKIIHKNSKEVRVKCLICGREHVLGSIYAFTKRLNTHGNICSKLVLKQHGGKTSSTIKQFYSIWCNMRTRTTNPNYEKWERYGGRGISSDVFKYFVDFYDTMYKSYMEHVETHGESETTLDRIDYNEDYSQENCRWATWIEQARNKDYLLDYIATDPSGRTYKGSNLKLFCETMGLDYVYVYSGLHQGNKTWNNGWIFKLV